MCEPVLSGDMELPKVPVIRAFKLVLDKYPCSGNDREIEEN